MLYLHCAMLANMLVSQGAMITTCIMNLCIAYEVDMDCVVPKDTSVELRLAMTA
jgi:hypothetical protein